MSWKTETGAIAAYVIGTLSITSDWWSMAFTQLSPELPVTVIGKGDGLAFAVIDCGEEQNLIWVVALDDSGEIWCSPN